MIARLAFAFTLAAATAAFGQTPPPAEPITNVLGAVSSDIVVDRPIDAVWSKVGDFCDIRDWVPTTCEIVAGKENEIGAVRSTGREFMVSKTKYSYTYGQFGSSQRPYRIYNGTVQAEPLAKNKTKLSYSFVWDVTDLDEAGRAVQRQQRIDLANRFLKNMKLLAEGGKPEPYRPAVAPGAVAPK